MRCLSAFALGLLGFSGVAFAQRGGATPGKVSVRSGAAPGVGFGSYRGSGKPNVGSQPQRFSNAFASRAPFAGYRVQGAGQGYPGPWSTSRPVYASRSQWRPAGGRSYMGYSPRGVGYGVPYTFLEPTVDPCFYGCPSSSQDPNVAGAEMSPWNDAGSPDPQAAGLPAYSVGPYGAPNAPYPAQAPEPYANGYQTPYAPQVPEPYANRNSAEYPAQPAYEPGAMDAGQAMMLVPLVPVNRAPNPPAEEEAVTLVFKDGRPPLQVRNYILTRSAIYLTGKHFNEILLSDIDLQATQRVNWDAGVTFRLP